MIPPRAAEPTSDMKERMFKGSFAGFSCSGSDDMV